MCRRSVTAFVFSACVASVTFASEPAKQQEYSDAQQAASLVAEAMQSEVEGDFLSRQRLLAEAETLVAEFAPARWQQGELQTADGDWVDLAECIKIARGNERLATYERRRASLPDNLNSHFTLASWCMERGLVDQCRSHLNRVLEFDPDNGPARAALGFTMVGTEWIGPEQLAELAARSSLATKSLQKYGERLQSIAVDIQDPKTQKSGIDALMSIDAPDAVPAVEAVLTSPSPNHSRIVIDWFASIDSVPASQTLARYSLFHPSTDVRAYATSALKTRPFHDFVPDMLNMLSAPVSTMIVPEFDRSGRLTGYRQAFAQEKFDKVDFLVLDRRFVREFTPLPDSDRTAPWQAALARARSLVVDNEVREIAANESLGRNRAVEQENEQIAERNARVGAVLSELADREFTSDANELWDWWDKLNETRYQDYKPERYRRAGLADRVADYEPPRRAGECFVGGTPVMTLRGRRPIEQVVVGDLVLSRDVQSGELGWKPVVRSTTRPPERTLVVCVGDEEFRCTSGHLFWVSGRAWQKASELKPGDILHAAREPIVVTEVRNALAAPTFNLRVADSANYFVGKNLVLTHDVTPRGPTRQRVPGQQLLER